MSETRNALRLTASMAALALALGAGRAVAADSVHAKPAAAKSAIATAAPGMAAAKSAAGKVPGGAPVSARASYPPGIVLEAPFHGNRDVVAFGGHGEVRFGHDRDRGIENPEWLSFPRIEAFALARVHRRAQLVVDAAYDRGMDQLTLERALVDVRVAPSWSVHAGVMLPPLGRANREHHAPRAQFSDRSLVASDLVGAPVSMFGIGIHGIRGGAGRPALTYELDVVNGYDDGVVTEAAEGTRVPSGRNIAGDNNGMPALAGRLAIRPSPGIEYGVAAYAGQYNTTEVEGTTVDEARYLHLVVVDGTAAVVGVRVTGEAGMAVIDVPPTLRAVFPEDQWGAALELSRDLLRPLVAKWKTSSVSLAIRGDAVDFDRAIPGDSRSRLSAALNIRPSHQAVIRGQWFYERVRDRFNNEAPAAGVAASGAIFF